jgi:hypothetical protein
MLARIGLIYFLYASIEMPDDFADDLYDSVYQRIGNALGNQQPQPPSWPEYSGAWLGLMYRYRSCADHDEVFTDSVNSFGDTPEWSERYKQERELFGFFCYWLVCHRVRLLWAVRPRFVVECRPILVHEGCG